MISLENFLRNACVKCDNEQSQISFSRPALHILIHQLVWYTEFNMLKFYEIRNFLKRLNATVDSDKFNVLFLSHIPVPLNKRYMNKLQYDFRCLFDANIFEIF